MAGEKTIYDNDAQGVHVTLSHAVEPQQVAFIENILGITVEGGQPYDVIALNLEQVAYQFTVPLGVAVSKGQIVYVDVTDLTGHKPDDSAYSTTAGANKRALFLALEDKDANNVVIGKLLPPFAS